MNNTNSWRSEYRLYLSRPDVKKYLDKYPDITPDEERDLAEWLKAGNSSDENDCLLFDERGCPLDFIDARRIFADLYAMQPQDPPEPYVPWEDDDYDLPF